MKIKINLKLLKGDEHQKQEIIEKHKIHICLY